MPKPRPFAKASRNACRPRRLASVTTTAVVGQRSSARERSRPMAVATSNLYKQSLQTMASKRSESDGQGVPECLTTPPKAPPCGPAAASTSTSWISSWPWRHWDRAAAWRRRRGSSSRSVAMTSPPEARAQREGNPDPQPISRIRSGLAGEARRRDAQRAITRSAATQAAGQTPSTPKASPKAEIACIAADPAGGCQKTVSSNSSSSSETTRAQICLRLLPGIGGLGETQTGMTL
mmetsp:Transcript_82738/g.246825  ORF Transcript_82738/g.246825 Transcript_82738/m.246825 type:complete len:235 (+) Transcript_82738:491-1195(+)